MFVRPDENILWKDGDIQDCRRCLLDRCDPVDMHRGKSQHGIRLNVSGDRDRQTEVARTAGLHNGASHRTVQRRVEVHDTESAAARVVGSEGNPQFIRVTKPVELILDRPASTISDLVDFGRPS